MTKYGLKNNDGRFSETRTDKIVVQNKVPMDYVIASAAAVATGAILSSQDFNATGTAAMTRTGILLQPPYPMAVSFTNNAAGSADDADAITIVGINAKGDTVTENVIIGSAADATTNTNNAYAEITTLTPNKTIKCTTLAVGFSSTIGLPWPIISTSDIISYSYLGEFATSAKVANITNVSTTYDTLGLKAIADGAKVKILYKTRIQNVTNRQKGVY